MVTGYGNLAQGSDLWRGGVELSELLAEDGTLDRDKLKTAAKRVVTDHPHWRAAVPSFDGGARATPPLPENPNAGFGEALRRAAR